jgi:uridylate kinase
MTENNMIISDEAKPVFKRVLLKLSGEAMANKTDSTEILDYEVVNNICKTIKSCIEKGVQVAIVVGGGNIWRGRQGVGMDRTRADHMGMLATVINALALQDAFEQLDVETRVMTAIEMKQFAEPYIRNRAVNHLDMGRVVIFGCGMGNPFFSTDTAAILRAAEVNADVVLMAKNVDGIYTADPKKDHDAVKLKSIRYKEILDKELSAIDMTATAFGMENKIPVLLFGLDDPNNIYRAVMGDNIGTIIKGG